MRTRVVVTVLLLAAAGAPGAEEATFEKLNEVFGVPLWADDNLWDDADTAVGARLEWPQESKTANQSSFRLYAEEKVRVLGQRPYSLALYGEGGQPARLSLIFVNKGDVGGVFDEFDLNRMLEDRKAQKALNEKIQKAMKDLPKQIDAEADAIEKALTAVLGQPSRDRFGQSKSTREKVLRWDWKGHAILLAAPEAEYVGVRILQPAEADSGGKPQRIKDADLRASLKGNVERRPNGDVVVSQIPMVDQGPKGFCVPATWERYLRYLGIPADMYVLAMAGNSQFGGGTSTGAMTRNIEDVVQRAGRRLDELPGKINLKRIAASIDDGLPLMWGVLVDQKFDMRDLTFRAEDRRKVTDWKEWAEKLKPLRKAAKDIKPPIENAHMRMIIGYNPVTEEIGISDSWGEPASERWLTVEEAAAISLGSLQLISW